MNVASFQFERERERERQREGEGERPKSKQPECENKLGFDRRKTHPVSGSHLQRASHVVCKEERGPVRGAAATYLSLGTRGR